MHAYAHRHLALLALGLTLSGCGKSAQQQAAADSTRNLEMAPAGGTAATPNDNPAPSAPGPAMTAAPKPAAAKPMAPAPSATLTLAAGTKIEAEAQDSISSRHTKAPVAFNAVFHLPVMDKNGKTAIPDGAIMRVRVTELAPAENKSQKDGKLKAILLKITIGDKVYTPVGTVDSIAHLVVGRGVTGGDVAKAGAGAAAGAVVGGLIGNTKGAIIGGVVGAGAGTAVAVETADRDVVIVPGSRVYVTLTEPLTVDVSHAPIR